MQVGDYEQIINYDWPYHFQFSLIHTFQKIKH